MSRFTRTRYPSHPRGSRAPPPPRYGRRGHWGYMGNSPTDMHPSSPPHREYSPQEEEGVEVEELRDLVAAITESEVEGDGNGNEDGNEIEEEGNEQENDGNTGRHELELPLINTGRDTSMEYRMAGGRVSTQGRHYASGGYPDAMFTDLSEKDREAYECNICFNVARDGVECPNKHLYCAACIYRWSVSQADSRSTCPVCRVYGRYRANMHAQNFLSRQTVQCLDCSWTGLLRDYKEHESTHRSITSPPPPPLVLPPMHTRVVNAQNTRGITGSTAHRVQQGRARIRSMLAQVRAEMEAHEQNIRRLQEERERQRQESLLEVRNIGSQLGEVAEGLVGLLDDIRIDSRRCHDYIRALRRGAHLPEIARDITQTIQSDRATRRRYRRLRVSDNGGGGGSGGHGTYRVSVVPVEEEVSVAQSVTPRHPRRRRRREAVSLPGRSLQAPSDQTPR